MLTTSCCSYARLASDSRSAGSGPRSTPTLPPARAPRRASPAMRTRRRRASAPQPPLPQPPAPQPPGSTLQRRMLKCAAVCCVERRPPSLRPRAQAMWADVYHCPENWWDQRANNASSPGGKRPDFKHKTNEQALWLWRVFAARRARRRSPITQQESNVVSHARHSPRLGGRHHGRARAEPAARVGAAARGRGRRGCGREGQVVLSSEFASCTVQRERKPGWSAGCTASNHPRKRAFDLVCSRTMMPCP